MLIDNTALAGAQARLAARWVSGEFASKAASSSVRLCDSGATLERKPSVVFVATAAEQTEPPPCRSRAMLAFVAAGLFRLGGRQAALRRMTRYAESGGRIRKSSTGYGIKFDKDFNWRREDTNKEVRRKFRSILLAIGLAVAVAFSSFSWTQANSLQAELQQKPARPEYVYKSDTAFRNFRPFKAPSAVISDVAQIPSPRLSGSWVTDLTSKLDAGTVFRINEICDRAKKQTGGEIAVVMVPRLEGGKPAAKPFATKLFNYWGIGERTKNNGVLVFVSVEDRRIEVEIGKGLNSVFNQNGWLKSELIDGIIAPKLKQNDWNGGVFAAVTGAAEKLKEVDSAISGPEEARTRATFSAALAALLGVAIYVVNLPGGAPSCSVCGSKMRRLRDANKDELVAGAQMEMDIGSVQHVLCGCDKPGCQKLWAVDPTIRKTAGGSMPAEGGRQMGGSVARSLKVRLSGEEVMAVSRERNAMGVQREKRAGSPFSSCRQCDFRTALSDTLALSPATEWSEGSMVSVSECCHCGYKDVDFSVVPRITVSASSSSSGSGFDGGGSSDGGGDGGDF
eukprot:TRINITY_DN67490_c0_g2_i1.p1 TRINITY_DN67490_c0_g2~~TRINITY_DN67490_c0_g2_i1.p1  ORF type:complete len:565 (+),score=85.43 TRINITY_DN67490_c0_g2_i1:110-1804(+)